MNVAMMQPTFMPWQGFFELIYKADRFVFLDDFQFSIQSYHQRNRLFINRNQVNWYSIPVQKSVSFKAPLNKVKINEKVPWRKNMRKRIQQNYCKATFYANFSPYVDKWLSNPMESLASQNIAFVKLVCDFLGLKREIRYSSQYPSEAKRSSRVLELLNWCEADCYYCANGAFLYMQKVGIFFSEKEDIEVLFQNFVPRSYSQIGATDSFIPFLSILDALLNIGPEGTTELIKNGTCKWLTWEDMEMNTSSLKQEKDFET